MSSIKEILNNLNDTDKQLWQSMRTHMRRSYLTTHQHILGNASWDIEDDAFMDLIDIKLAIIFDRAGRFRDVVAGVDEKAAAQIEADLAKASEDVTKKLRATPATLALVDSAANWPVAK